MNDTENSIPANVQDQPNISVKSNLENNKANRTPFKDIGNKPTINKSPLKDKPTVTPSRFEVIRSLDEDEHWRERTEVVTKLEHTTYKFLARELLEETIDKLPSISGDAKTPATNKFSKMAFRDTAVKDLDESTVGLNETVTLLDTTISSPVVPVVNSTMLNATRSNPPTPTANSSKSLFENSLLSSFEKMKIKVTKGQNENEDDDDDQDIFHDASDDFDTFSATPSKNNTSGTPSKNNQTVDPLDCLLNSLEKITVSDEQKEVPKSNSNGPFGLKNISVESKVNDHDSDTITEIPLLGTDKDSRSGLNSKDSKGNFQSPDFNPFLIGTENSSNLPTESEEINKAIDNQTQSMATATDNEVKVNIPISNDNSNETAIPDLISKNQEVPAPSVSTKDEEETEEHPKDILSKSLELQEKTSPAATSPKRKYDEAFAEEPPKRKHYEAFKDETEDEGEATSEHNVMTLEGKQSTSDVNLDAEGNTQTAGVEALADISQGEIVPPKKGYNLDFLEAVDDPNFNPFATKTAVTNSPDKKTGFSTDTEPIMKNENKGNDKGLEFLNTQNTPKIDKVEKSSTVCSNKDAPEDIKEKIPFISEANGMERKQDDVSNESSQKESSADPAEKQETIEVDGEDEEIPVPKKGYQLDFLDNLDDPNFDPFATKVAVVNTPEKASAKLEGDCTTNTVHVTSEIKDEPDQIAEEFQDSKPAALPKESATNDNKSTEKGLQESMTITVKSTDSTETQKTNEVDGEDGEILVPKKGYQLDFLDNLDDPNFDPFATKVAVVNTPEKGSAKMKENCATNPMHVTGEVEHKPNQTNEDVQNKKSTVEQKDTEPVPVPKTSVVNDDESPEKSSQIQENVAVATNSKDSTENQETFMDTDLDGEQEEMAVPQKGYQLDFLDNLDDPNFDPFATKVTVVNTPEKESAELNKICKAAPNAADKIKQKPNGEIKNIDDKSNIDLKETKPATTEKCAISEKSVGKKSKQAEKNLQSAKNQKSESMVKESCEQVDEDETPIPKKGYQLDFLDNLDDPNFNPFATKVSVVNSPEKEELKESTVVDNCKQEIKKESEKKDDDSQNNQDASKKKPKAVKKMPLKKKIPAVVKAKTEKSESESKEEKEEDIIAPKKAYQFDFDKFDDPNFNPFASKTSVSNSPKKEEASAVDVTPSSPTNDKITAVDNSPSEMDETCSKSPKKNENVQLSKGDMKSAEVQKEIEIKLPQKDQFSILDHLDDPNFNPFASKSAVANSPVKNSTLMGNDKALNSSTEGNETLVKVGDHTPKSKSDKTPSRRRPVATPITCPPPSAAESAPSVDEHFDAIVKDTIRSVREIAQPKGSDTEKNIPTPNVQAQQKDVFSPMPAASTSAKKDSFNFEEFMDATDFFNNPGDLDSLSEYGTDGDKLNLVRNSLYMKFDPLVSGRKSLAPYLAQQKIASQEPDPRRGSALICFSPSSDKIKQVGHGNGPDTPVKALFKTRADETEIVDTNCTINDTVVAEGHNATVVFSSNATTAAAPMFNTTIISQGGRLHNETLAGPMVTERMYTEDEVNKKVQEKEQEFLNKIAELEQKTKLVMQDLVLRQARELQDLKESMKKQAEESDVALFGLEEDNDGLRKKIKQLQTMMVKVIEQEKLNKEENTRNQILMENKYDIQLENLKKESMQYQEELKKMEVPFYDLVQKYKRLQEVTEALRNNEEALKSELEAKKATLSKKEQGFKAVMESLEQKFNKAQEEFQEEKDSHEKEKNKLFLLLKKAEMKILSLQGTVEKTTAESKQLTALLDDITNKFS